MVKKLYGWPILRLGLAGGLVALVTLLLLGFAGGGHSLAQSAKLSIGSNSASPGTTVMITGFDYPTAKKVDVYFQNRSNGVVSAVTSAGGFFNVPLKLPKKYSNGPSYVYAVVDNHTTKTRVTFAKPSVTYAPANTSSVAAPHIQAPTMFNGAGFIANEPVHFVLHSKTGALKKGTLMTDSQGNFALPLKLPDIPFHSKAMLSVSDSGFKAISVAVALTPTITLNPAAGAAGTNVGLNGTGFGPNEIVKISFQNMLSATVYTNIDGSFVTAFTMPASGSINNFKNDIRVIGQRTGATATTSFQVRPSVSLYPSTGNACQTVHMIGEQFSPFGHVSVVLLNPNVSSSTMGASVATASPSAYGVIDKSVAIPCNLHHKQEYLVTTIDTTTGISVASPFYVK
jgi:hypothetical protein